MNLFMITMPLWDWPAVRETARQMMRDFADVVRLLPGATGEEAERVVLVMGNLNTHKNEVIDGARITSSAK